MSTEKVFKAFFKLHFIKLIPNNTCNCTMIILFYPVETQVKLPEIQSPNGAICVICPLVEHVVAYCIHVERK